jgi:hypothetical protein
MKNAAEPLQHVRNALRVIVLSRSLGKLASSSWRPYRPDDERRRSISNGLSKAVACAPPHCNDVCTTSLSGCRRCNAIGTPARGGVDANNLDYLPEAADTSLEAPAQKTTTMNAGSELPAR